MLVVRGMYKRGVELDRSGNGYFQYGHGNACNFEKYKGIFLLSVFGVLKNVGILILVYI